MRLAHSCFAFEAGCDHVLARCDEVDLGAVLAVIKVVVAAFRRVERDDQPLDLKRQHLGRLLQAGVHTDIGGMKRVGPVEASQPSRRRGTASDPSRSGLRLLQLSQEIIDPLLEGRQRLTLDTQCLCHGGTDAAEGPDARRGERPCGRF
ncbi:hypothetical protein [Streptomyces olivochromogenes]|uniref:hypothetical protein n=1 Tax=Streptomyces olivochromogenes TaxID=1963 RepID=UPI0036CF2264